eukprot:5566936-Pleurochrysis_carterae.AAC.1
MAAKTLDSASKAAAGSSPMRLGADAHGLVQATHPSWVAPAAAPSLLLAAAQRFLKLAAPPTERLLYRAYRVLM